ncbi:MAG: serine protease [Treponema sp.]|nr:serine protease [Treponema sp.]
MKRQCIFFLLIVNGFRLFGEGEASLRDYVCLVEAAHQHVMHSGSGFVYVDSRGNNYILTNHHVIERSNVISVLFFRQDGRVERHDDIKVIYENAAYDLAVLSFPSGRRPFARGLKIASGSAIDNGLEVFSAGYPGMVWRYSKGIISRRSAVLPVKESGSPLSFIQHTAEISDGSSGGPLLAGEPDTLLKYAVIGINTLKGSGGRYFAIPMERVTALLDAAINPWNRGKEPNDTPSRAAVIFFGKETGGSIKTGNHDWYRIDSSTGGEIIVEVYGETGVDITLYGSDAASVLGKNSGVNPAIAVRIFPEEIYYIEVKGREAFWETYTIMARLIPEPDQYEPDGPESPLPLTGDASWVSRTLHRDDEDWFSLTTRGPGLFIAETAGNTGTFIECYDTRLRSIAGNHDGGPGGNARVFYRTETPETRLIRVRGFNNAAGAYLFRAVIAVPEKEPNNIMDEAQEIDTKTPVSAVCISVLDNDWYKLLIPPGGRELAVRAEAHFALSLVLYDTTGNVILRGGQDQKITARVPGGTVYLRVKPKEFAGDRSRYLLHVQENTVGTGEP